MKFWGSIHRKYLVVPGRFRDYISVPKNSGYQSLHTGIIGPLNKRIEIQIRTQEMHKVSEFGVAAHWNYKEGMGAQKIKPSDQRWIRNLIEILNNSAGIDEFVSHSKTEMLGEKIFCLSPKGQIISLPKGASVLDFAYAIHSDVGNKAVEAKVNNSLVPLQTMLKNGDQVEIIISDAARPEYAWENYVVTVKAKSGIKKALNSLYNEKITVVGKTNIDEFFKQHGIVLKTEDYEKILKEFGLDSLDHLFQSVGRSEKVCRKFFMHTML